MATFSKPYRLVNGRKKRNPKRLSLKQKLHFGTKRQRAAAKASLKGKRKKSNPHRAKLARRGMAVGQMKATPQARYKFKRSYERLLKKNKSKRRRKNVGSILTVFNPGTKVVSRKKRRNMASSKRRRAGLKAARTRRRRMSARRNPIRRRRYSVRRRRHNPVVRRRRHHVARHRRRSYRRNPSMFSGTVGKVVGVVGGATVTKLLCDTVSGMVPMVASGIPSYISSAVIAFLQGKVVGKLLKNPSLGSDMAVGGYTYVALKVLNDFLPSFGNPFGMSGMGLLTSSNNWGPPWVNQHGSMTRFVRPGGAVAAIPAPMPTSGVHGLGRVRRVGRLA